jgi:hypothetical protein
VGEVAGGAGDPARQVQIEEEVLAERASGAEPVAGDDLAQRRQAGRVGVSHDPGDQPRTST